MAFHERSPCLQAQLRAYQSCTLTKGVQQYTRRPCYPHSPKVVIQPSRDRRRWAVRPFVRRASPQPPQKTRRMPGPAAEQNLLAGDADRLMSRGTKFLSMCEVAHTSAVSMAAIVDSWDAIPHSVAAQRTALETPPTGVIVASLADKPLVRIRNKNQAVTSTNSTGRPRRDDRRRRDI